MRRFSMDQHVFGRWFDASSSNMTGGYGDAFAMYPRATPYKLPYMFLVSEAEDFFYYYKDQVWFVYAKDCRGLFAALAISMTYLILTFTLKRWMRDRPRYTLRRPLILWNVIMCVFSAFGAARMLPEFVDMYRERGLYGTVCDGRCRYTGLNLWGWLYLGSKALELIDTAFIVLRKQTLIFLHYYHHTVTLLYMWVFGMLDEASLGRWFMTMNFTIHAVMYGYYGVKASGVLRVPKRVSVVITCAQILQMLAGFSLSLWAWALKGRGGGEGCQISYPNLMFCIAMYSTYALLFIYYFRQNYLAAAPRQRSAIDKHHYIKHQENNNALNFTPGTEKDNKEKKQK